MVPLFALLFSLNMVSMPSAPAGTGLHIRLMTTIGSYASKPGTPVKAALIAPVTLNAGTALPAGSIVSGSVKSVTRVGLGLLHERAKLRLDFKSITLPSGENLPISTRLLEVDNGSERVNAQGAIEGLRSTSGMCYRVSGYIKTALTWEMHARIAVWAIRSLIVQLPEPEIYFPSGSELTLALTEKLAFNKPLEPERVSSELNCQERVDLARLVETMPTRTYAPESRRASDLTNIVLLGTRQEVQTAFLAAGWAEAHATSMRRRIKFLRAAAENRGDRSAPMSLLLLNGAAPDMSWQKGLNDVSKRHHVRVWRQSGTWYGKEIWLAAGTHDVDFAYMRRGAKITHKIDENIDQERDKVAYDLAYTSCGTIVDWTERPVMLLRTYNATGDPMSTDSRMVVVRLNSCSSPRLATETLDASTVPSRGGTWQRFLRREIISTRSDLIRSNMYWRIYEGGRFAFDYTRAHWPEPLKPISKEPANAMFAARQPRSNGSAHPVQISLFEDTRHNINSPCLVDPVLSTE